MCDRYLMRVKPPEKPRGPWDLLAVAGTVPAAEAAKPLSESTCLLVRA